MVIMMKMRQSPILLISKVLAVIVALATGQTCTGTVLTLRVPSANSVSLLEIAAANWLIHASFKNCIVYLF